MERKAQTFLEMLLLAVKKMKRKNRKTEN